MPLKGEFLASPILKKLCQSFYKEEKWQRSLTLQANADNEWAFSVPLMMVALAAIAMCTLSCAGFGMHPNPSYSIAMHLRNGKVVTRFQSHSKQTNFRKYTTRSMTTSQSALMMIPRLNLQLIA